MSKREDLLDLFKLRKAMFNYELNAICYRYSARIKELRDAGWDIVTSYVKPGVFKYTFKGRKAV